MNLPQFVVPILTLALVASPGWGQEVRQWTILETSAGKSPARVSYQRVPSATGGQSLVCRKQQRIQTTVVDGSGSTLSWTRSDNSGLPMELTREGGEFVSRSAEGTTRFPGGKHRWFQDLNQLSGFVVGPDREIRFVAFADFLDTRLKASDMTVFRATKVVEEPKGWGTATGLCWKVRVTFDDLRSAFWGADYWFRVSDGQLVRYEEVRGGPGTPVTVGVVVEERT